jgi:hypothetical protein
LKENSKGVTVRTPTPIRVCLRVSTTMGLISNAMAANGSTFVGYTWV